MLRRLVPVVFSSFLLAAPAKAGPVLLDRVVALVDDRSIFRSEVIAHASHDIEALELRERSDPKKVDGILKAMLARMIDDQIIAKETQRLRVSVDDAEVDGALGLIAKTYSMDRAALLETAKKQGLSEAEYRAEVRRQLLEGKWVQLRVKPRVKEPLTGTEQERREQYEALVELEKKRQLALLRAESFVEVHW